MNCNCLTDVKEKITAHVLTKGVVNPRVSANFIAIDLSTGEGVILMAYTVHGDNRPFNTQNGKPTDMVASHCPFCGKSVKKEPT